MRSSQGDPNNAKPRRLTSTCPKHLRIISTNAEYKQRLAPKDLCHYIGELACELKLLAELAGCDKLAADLHCIAIEAVLEARLQAG